MCWWNPGRYEGMDKVSLEKSMSERTNGSAWISVSKLRKWLGVGNDKFKDFTDGLERRVNGNRLEYFIPDVAERIMEKVE